jgi:hypothetical protein
MKGLPLPKLTALTGIAKRSCQNHKRTILETHVNFFPVSYAIFQYFVYTGDTFNRDCDTNAIVPGGQD